MVTLNLVFLLPQLLTIVKSQSSQALISGLPDNAFSSKDEWDKNICAAHFAKLDDLNAWCPKEMPNSWLQIDLGDEYIITSITTKGAGYGGEWTETYELKYGITENSLVDYENNPIWANDDASSKDTTDLDPTPIARYLKFYPKDYNSWPALRVEAYGYLYVTPNPSTSPTSLTAAPTQFSTQPPTKSPTNMPTISPTKNPTITPTIYPSKNPTNNPTNPSKNPTNYPSENPSKNPTNNPSKQPTSSPVLSPTKNPLTPGETHYPTLTPTNAPTPNSTDFPTFTPSNNPTQKPTFKPSKQPTNTPTLGPTITVTQSEESPEALQQTENVFVFAIYILLVVVFVASICFCVILTVCHLKKRKKSKKTLEAVEMERVASCSNWTSMNSINSLNSSKPNAVAGEPGGITLDSWLSNMGLNEYYNIFVANGFELGSAHTHKALFDLNNEDLKDMGITKVAHRKFILLEIRKFHSQNAGHNESSESKSAEAFVGANTYQTNPESYNFEVVSVTASPKMYDLGAVGKAHAKESVDEIYINAHAKESVDEIYINAHAKESVDEIYINAHAKESVDEVYIKADKEIQHTPEIPPMEISLDKVEESVEQMYNNGSNQQIEMVKQETKEMKNEMDEIESMYINKNNEERTYMNNMYYINDNTRNVVEYSSSKSGESLFGAPPNVNESQF